ncbi:MAG TPA: alpha-amylase family glycosyl hydrolase [Melioribacteraceae bacterium]|nr:alpha-amylase family glycosyl hydrolase [Melioribacteraceae bacterium]
MKTPNDLIFYHIYALGFCDSLHKNDFIEHNQNKLKLIEEKIDHIKYLGCNAVYIGPVFESTFHGYDTIDYYNIDRRLGNNLLFKELVNKFHINNVKVIVDTVFNHVGREFSAFKDVLLHRKTRNIAAGFVG